MIINQKIFKMKKTTFLFLKANNILLFVFITITFFSCKSTDTANSNDVSQKEIYQSYWLSFDANDNQITATAKFRFGGSGGTTLLLTEPSNVVFNTKTMMNKNNMFSGTYYEIVQKEKDKEKTDYNFIYTDNDNNTYTNTAILIPATIIKYPESISLSEEFFTVEWDLPLANNESIDLYIDGIKIYSESTTHSRNITVTKEILEEKQIKPGTYKLYIEREGSAPIEECNHLGGKMTVTYKSKKGEIEIKK